MTDSKENFIDKYVFNPTFFKILILVFALLIQIPFVHFVIGNYVKIALGYGLLVCLWQLIGGRMFKCIKSTDSIMLIAFLALYLITIVVNRKYSFSDNVNQFVYMGTFFYLLYMSPKSYTKEQVSSELKVFLVGFLTLSFIASLMSLITLLFNIYAAYHDDAAYYYVGVFGNRLWGIYNPNVCALVSSLSLLVSNAFLVEWKQHKPVIKVFIILNVIIQFSCMVATGSRTALYGFIAVMFIATAIIMYKKRIKLAFIKRLAISTIAAVICVATLIGASLVTKEVLPHTSKAALKTFGLNARTVISIQDGEGEILLPSKTEKKTQSSVGSSSTHNKKPSAGVQSLERDDIDSAADLTNRDDIWRFGLSAFKTSPVIGVSWRGIQDMATSAREAGKMTYDLWINIYGGSLHNSYITILASSGVLGLAVFLAFSLLNAVKYLKVILSKEKISTMALLMCIIVAYFFITEFVEARILYIVGLGNVMFWASFGYATKLMSDDDVLGDK